MIQRHVLFIVWLVLATGRGFAADPAITARFEPAAIAPGETVELKITLTEVPWELWRGLRVPRVEGLIFVKATSSSSTTRSEGALRQQHVLTFVFRPERSGAFVVPAQALRWENESSTVPQATLQVAPARGLDAVGDQEAKDRPQKSSAQLQARNTREQAASRLNGAADQP